MKASPYLVLALLVTVCFTVATTTQPHALNWSVRAQADSVLKVLLGDGRRLFANHFFTQADVAFHSGFYPSIFDQREKPKESPMQGGHEEQDEHAGQDHQDEHGHDQAAHEKEMAFLNQPRDWIERFGRHFRHTQHTELSGEKTREILPWLRLSAELNPQRVQTYTVAAFWLRGELGKVAEAEQFLRDGLRANPRSYEILFSLGQLQYENHHDPIRARNLWEVALRRWREQEPGKEEPDISGLREIALNLARLEEEQGNPQRAIEHLELAKTVSPHPEALQKQIDELQRKLATVPP
jgi:tetratricopeptide (TPR) repeat protein